MFYILIILILLLYINYSPTCSESYSETAETRCCRFICIVLVLLAAFRSDAVGTDTSDYRIDYCQLVNYHSITDLVDRFSIDYIGYFGLSKLFSMAHMPVQVWFGFIEAFYLYALMKLVNRFSRDRIFSLLLFVTIGLYSFSLAGLKQTLASSFMVLSFICFLDKKYWLAAMLVIATYYTHQAALVFLAVFPLYYVRKTKWLIPCIIVLITLLSSYGLLFISTMVDILNNEHFQDYLVYNSAYTPVTFIFYVVITLFASLFFVNYKTEESEFARFFLAASLVGCGLQLLAGASPSLFRLALLYTPFMMLLLPNSVYYLEPGKSRYLRIMLMGCTIFYFLYTSRNFSYSFG